MLEWKDVLQSVASALGGDAESGICVLEFLKILPEEVTEGRRITLTVCADDLLLLDSHKSGWIGRLWI